MFMGDNTIIHGRNINNMTQIGGYGIKGTIENVQPVIPVQQNQDIYAELEHGKERKNAANENNIRNCVEKLNKFLEGEATHIEYERHKDFKNDFIVKIVDNKTKKVIKEIPSEKMLDMVAQLCKLAGVIVDKKV